MRPSAARCQPCAVSNADARGVIREGA